MRRRRDGYRHGRASAAIGGSRVDAPPRGLELRRMRITGLWARLELLWLGSGGGGGTPSGWPRGTSRAGFGGRGRRWRSCCFLGGVPLVVNVSPHVRAGNA